MSVSRRTALLGLPTLFSGCGAAGYRGPERELTIAAGESGGFYLAFAELLAAELSNAEPRLHARAVATEASIDNVHRLRDGTADLSLVLADVAQAALAGTGPFSAPAAAVPLRAIGRVYENYLQLVVRAGGPLRGLPDLAGRRVSLGAAGSGAALFGERLLAAAGLRVRAEHLLLTESIGALRSGGIDALLWSGGVPTPALATLDREVAIRLLPLDGVLPALRAAHGPVYEQVRVPAGAYRTAGEPTTIGVANLLVATAAQAEDVAAAVVRVLVRRAADLVPAQAVGTQFLDVRALIGTGSGPGTVPLHPGAAAAYRALHG